jgi:hypothetical protein
MVPAMRRFLSVVVLISCACGVLVTTAACDEKPRVLREDGSAEARQVVLSVRPIAQLEPNRRTSLLIDPAGNLYWSQISREKTNEVVTMGQSLVPRLTDLTAESVLRACGKPGGDGRFLTLCIDGNGVLHFYFNGGHRREPVCVLGTFRPATGEVRILSEMSRLEELAGMHETLPLADAQIIYGGGFVTLWLHHADASAFLRYQPGRPSAAGGILISRVFGRITLEGRDLRIGDDWTIHPGKGGEILLFDRSDGIIWGVGERSEARLVASVSSLPAGVSAPLLTGDDSLQVFVPDAPLLDSTANLATDLILPGVTFPAIVEISPTSSTGIGRQHMRFDPSFPAHRMQLQQLVPESQPGSWVGYDSASGSVVRLRRELE